MHPILFQTDFFGLLSTPWTLHTYGVFYALAFVTAMSLIKRQAEREDQDPDHFIDLCFYVLLWNFIGARILFIFTQIEEYIRNPLQIFMFWRGGLVFYGGFISAAIYLIWHCRRHKLSIGKTTDIFIPYVALAHAIGRFGCLCAGCCFGKPTHEPWGIIFPQDSMAHSAQVLSGLIGINATTLPVHPTQLYAVGLELFMFWLLITIRHHKRFHGQLTLLWLALYPLGRSIIEMFRGDKIRGVYILSTSQYISIAIALTALILYIRLKKHHSQAAL